MVWCVAEIYLFQVFAKTETEKRATKGIISNLLNRLIIMLDEEMLFAECEKYLLVRSYIEEFEKKDRGDFACLYKICEIMCGARMIRRNSDIRGFWDSKRWKTMPYQIVDDSDGSDEYYFSKFKEEFEKNESKCFIWMFKIFNKGEEGDVVRYRRKENIYMIWKYLFDRKNIKNNLVLRKCLEYRFEEFKKKNRHERYIFLSASIDMAMYLGIDEECGWFVKCKKKDDTGDLKKKNDEKFDDVEIINKVFKDWKKMEIDDYAIDMHTSAGRKMGKNKVDFIASGAVVVDEDKEYFMEEWRNCYNYAKKASFAAAVALRKKKEEAKLEKEKKKAEKVNKKVNEVEKVESELMFMDKMVVTGKIAEPKKEKTDRAKARSEKNKRIKKLRGKSKFDDLEKDLPNKYLGTTWLVAGGDSYLMMNKIALELVNGIKLCGEKTCGNKVMCFEYDGQIWKESRKSMNYNRDYACFDECKELFGLKKIGMKRMLTNFRIVRKDKDKKTWTDNWEMEYIDIKKEEPIVYCVMNKVGVHKNSKEIKKLILSDRKYLRQFAKIGIVRGIFRVSDFNIRNIMVDGEGDFVSIDEGEIGTRLDIIGGREKWLIKRLNKDKKIINEIVNEVDGHLKKEIVIKKMVEYKFSDELCGEVLNNWKNLYNDLKSEGVEF